MKSYDDLGILNVDDSEYKTRISDKYKERKGYEPANSGMVTSFIPGTVVELLVSEGDMVEKGSELLVLDAMKMKNRLLSLRQGRVKKIYVATGDRVPKGTILIEVE